MTRTGPKESSRCACTVHQHGSHQDQNRRNTNNAVISTTPTCSPTTEGQNTNNVADAGSNVSMAYANDSESIEPGVAVSANPELDFGITGVDFSTVAWTDLEFDNVFDMGPLGDFTSRAETAALPEYNDLFRLSYQPEDEPLDTTPHLHRLSNVDLTATSPPPPPRHTALNACGSREPTAAAPGSRCLLQCQAVLTKHLGTINQCQDDGAAALCELLSMDDQVRKSLSNIMGCSICMGKSRHGQTLMLATIVVSNLLSLFEGSLDATSGFADGFNQRSRRDSALGSSPLLSPGSEVQRSSSSLTDGGLMLDKLQLSEGIKLSFSQRLVRMYLDRQEAVMRRIYQRLSVAGTADVNTKIAYELLEDVGTRVDKLLAYVTMMGRADREDYETLLFSNGSWKDSGHA